MTPEARKAIIGLVLGFLIPALVLAFICSPVDELPSVIAPPSLPAALVGIEGPAAPDETRIIVLGASLTSGYPYAPELRGSYASYLGVGLRSLHPDKEILCEAWAKPALDSSRLVEMCKRALELSPTLLVVTLGSNEFANRVFSGQVLVPDGPLDRLSEKLSRSRILFDLAAQSLQSDALDVQKRQTAAEKRILELAFESAPGKPGLSGLPISRADQDLLIDRLRRSMITISEMCRAGETPLVFCVANYALGGFWPWGVSQGGPDALVDELVDLYRQGHGAELLGRVEKALAKRERRADLRFLHGRLLEEAGRFGEAKVEFDRARDLDGVPMHLTGEIRRTLLETANELSRECLMLDTPFEALGKGGIPPRSYYLDYGHLDESGHARLALWLAEKLATGRYLPALGEAPENWGKNWRELFHKAVTAYQIADLQAESRKLARARMANANGSFSMLFGNYRDALPYLVTAFEGCLPATKADISIRLATCLLRLSGRDKEIEGMGEVQQFYDRIFRAFLRAEKVGKLRVLVERLRQGAKLAEAEKY